LVVFEGSSIREISGFQHAMLSVFQFPAPPACSIAFLRVFIEYPTDVLSIRHRSARMKAHAQSAPTKPHLPVAVLPPFQDLPELWRAGCPDRTFASSLFISLRVSDASCFSVSGSNSRHPRYFRVVGLSGQTMSQPERSPPTVPLEPVIAMFSFLNIRCEKQNKHRLYGQFIFHIVCDICGPSSQILVKCPPSGSDFTVSTQGCCSHFFVGKDLPQDRRTGEMLITRPHIARCCDYPTSHRLRVIARALVRSGQLSLPTKRISRVGSKQARGCIVASPKRPVRIRLKRF
jgi:hypothetical protein